MSVSGNTTRESDPLRVWKIWLGMHKKINPPYCTCENQTLLDQNLNNNQLRSLLRYKFVLKKKNLHGIPYICLFQNIFHETL